MFYWSHLKYELCFYHKEDVIEHYLLLSLISTYGRPVRYIDQLSRSLNVEYKHYGVDVQCQVCMQFPLHLYIENQK